MFEIKEETSKEVFFECLRLGEQHYNEVEAKSDKVKYNLNYDMASALIDLGLVRVITARKDGNLVGYFGVLVTEDFFTSRLTAKELGIYVAPEARGTTCFFRMTKLVESILRDEGVVALELMFKAGHDRGIAERLGYEVTETVYQKFLGE